MKFLIQKEYDEVELNIIIPILKSNRIIHEYEIVSEDFFKCIGDDGHMQLKEKEDFDIKYMDYVPIGNIPFTDNYYKIFYGIENQNPIEIPKCLRKPKFVKRDYSIIKGSELPRNGYKFIKNALRLKSFTYTGQLSYFLFDEMFEEPKPGAFDNSIRIHNDWLYTVSEVVDIQAEYRVYIIDGKITAIEFYNGNPLVFPDVDFIKEANGIYSLEKDYPKSYSLDVMVNNRGTSIIEVHAFNSLGLYTTLWGDNLLYAYADSKEYTLKHNTEPEECNVVYNEE